MTTIIGLSGFSPIMITIMVINSLGKLIHSEIVMFSIIGILPAALVIFVFQNNPIRFFKAVEKVSHLNERKEKMKKEVNNNILPLGSVVTLKNGDCNQLMIITRAIQIEEDGEEVYYDYESVLIPEGMSTPENVYFFNIENVENVIFKGFGNDKEIEYQKNYNQIISKANVTKGQVKMK
ncbi:DUF4176 domain-containing protein [Streptococcus parauberis]|uniref:DUF4176 domain-containing protein n=1 Tax=Streptococcus parauberis TaxID=1348 RepID=UPI000CCFB373|nr:DUF4176 domain-containing protein [Streptococcus parauberis]PNY18934.1 hypothetical protein ASN86_00791 [Streptococcus parauberis]